MKWEMLDHEAQRIVRTIENDQRLANKFVSYYSLDIAVGSKIRERLSESPARYCIGHSGNHGAAIIQDAGFRHASATSRNNAFRWLLHSLFSVPLELAFPEHYETDSAEQTPQPEEPIMNGINIETRTYVNGADISGLSDDQVFATIAAAEAEVRKLEAIEAKPAKLQAKIDALKANIVKLGELVDAR